MDAVCQSAVGRALGMGEVLRRDKRDDAGRKGQD